MRFSVGVILLFVQFADRRDLLLLIFQCLSTLVQVVLDFINLGLQVLALSNLLGKCLRVKQFLTTFDLFAARRRILQRLAHGRDRLRC